jgi:hypothetical protein
VTKHSLDISSLIEELGVLEDYLVEIFATSQHCYYNKRNKTLKALWHFINTFFKGEKGYIHTACPYCWW